MAEKLAIPSSFADLPVVTAAQMQELDRKASAQGISTDTLMEHAGRGVARELLDFAERALGRKPEGLKVVLCCGRGNNGGDGLVAARYLKEWEAAPTVFLVAAKENRSYPPPVQTNLGRAQERKVPVVMVQEDTGSLAESLSSADLAVDALLGTGSSGKPSGTPRKMIQQMMKSKAPIVAVDLPSGLHPDTGYHSGVFIQARLTLTLGLAKRGLLATHAQRYVGELKVLDIGFPKELLNL